MPRVPNVLPSVRVGSLPAIKQSAAGATPEAFGASEARALGQAGEQMFNIGVELQQRRNAADAQDAYRKAYDELRLYLRDEQTGVLNKRGENTRGILEQSVSKMEELMDKHAQELNGESRKAFERFWDTTRRATLDTVAGHEAREYQVMNLENQKSIINSFSDQILEGYQDPRTIELGLQGIQATVRAMGRDAGWTVVQERDVIQNAETGAITNIIEKYLAEDNPAMAEQVMNQYADKINPKVKTALTQKAQNASSLIEAQKIAMDASVNNPGDFMSQLRVVEKSGLTGQTLEKAKTLVRARFSDEQAANRARQNEMLDQFYGSVISDQNVTAEEAMARAWKMPIEVRKEAVQMASVYRSHKDNAPEPMEAPAIKDEIMQRIDSNGFDSKAEVRQAAADNNLNSRSTERLVQYYEGGGLAGKLKRTQVNDAIKDLTGGNKDITDYKTMYDEVYRRIPSGMDPTPIMVKEIVRGLLSKGEVTQNKEWYQFYDPNTELIQAVGTPKEVGFEFDISDEEKTRLVEEYRQAAMSGPKAEALRARGVNPEDIQVTPELLQKLYRAKYIRERQR